jgi:hypothetical protein
MLTLIRHARSSRASRPSAKGAVSPTRVTEVVFRQQRHSDSADAAWASSSIYASCFAHLLARA